MSDFDKWWNDPKKHWKRLHHWLPHWRGLAKRVGKDRSLRYFTLCAQPMIDVFMLVKARFLQVDDENHSIDSVRFCECDQEHFSVIKELIGKEDAGVLGRLEDVALFNDNDFTAKFPTLDSIAVALEDERLSEDEVNHLQLKRTFINFQTSFPYDFLNLDFCEYYYPNPPDMLRINRTVEQCLDWQKNAITAGKEKIHLDEFIMAITCRHDTDFPAAAEARLTALIRENCETSPEYKGHVEKTRGVANVEEWLQKNKEDFFFSGWPKDVARAARDRGWATTILDYVYYRRVGDHDENTYVIACLVIRFTRANPHPNYLPTVLYALNEGNRKFIDNIDLQSPEGKKLSRSLSQIVALRNKQARRVQRPELPAP